MPEHSAHHFLIRVGVMGSAALAGSAEIRTKCRALGRAIAVRNFCLLTGACPGLPHETVLGTKEAGGHVVGISPASNRTEHVKVFNSPYEEYDVMIYTGLGLMGRELINIRSSDVVIVVGGRSGTLGEFAIAYEEGKLIGVLEGTGGVADSLAQLEPFIAKSTDSRVIYNRDPDRLVDELAALHLSSPVAPQT